MSAAPSGVLPLRFQETQRAFVALRLTVQAKQALTEAYSSGTPCSMRFDASGSGNQELVVGGQVFPFVAHEQTQHTEVLRFKGSGSSAKAAELGTVSHKLQLQPQLDEAQRKRTRERGAEAERGRKERKVMLLNDKDQQKAGKQPLQVHARSKTPPPTRIPSQPPSRARTPPPRAPSAQPPTRTPTPQPSAAPGATLQQQARPAAAQAATAGRGATPQPLARSVTPEAASANAKKLRDFGKHKSKGPVTAAVKTLKAPIEAIEGAKRGGLRLCLLGMFCHGAKRKKQAVDLMLADAIRRVPTLKQPTDASLQNTLKSVAVFQSPGAWLLDPYTKALAREAKELEEAAANGTAPPSTESSGTTDRQTGSISRTASAEDPAAQAKRSTSPSPVPFSARVHRPKDTAAAARHKKSQSAPPPAHKPVQPRPVSPAPSPPRSPARKPAAAQPAAREQVDLARPASAQGGSSGASGNGSHTGGGASPAAAPLHGRKRTVLEDSDDSDGLGHAPEPLQPASAPEPVTQPAPLHRAAPDKAAVNGVAGRLAGAPSLSSSWDDGASQTTWFEEHLSRPPELELAPLATAEAFQEAKRTYSRKLEIWERLHRLRRKFDRQFKALSAATARASQQGNLEQQVRWEREVEQLLLSKGKLAEEWTKAYWLLHQELCALRRVVDAYWNRARTRVEAI